MSAGLRRPPQGTPPQLRRILTRAAMGDDARWFGSGPVRSCPRPSVAGKPLSRCRVSGPDRGPQGRGATDPGSNYREAVLARPARRPLRSRLRLRLTWKRNSGCVAMATSSASRISPRLFLEGGATTDPQLEEAPSTARTRARGSI